MKEAISNLKTIFMKDSAINRFEFLIGVVAAYLIFAAISYGYFYLFRSAEIPDIWYLVGKSIFELMFLVILVPISIARLNDINWSKMFVLLYFPCWIFGIRNVIIYDMAFNESRGFGGMWYVYLTSVLALLAVVLFLVLLFKPTLTRE